jgi:hypothetical protein
LKQKLQSTFSDIKFHENPFNVFRLLQADIQMDKNGEANTLHFATFRREGDETMYLE